MEKQKLWKKLALSLIEDTARQLTKPASNTIKTLTKQLALLKETDSAVPPDLCGCQLHAALRQRMDETKSALEALKYTD